MKVDLPVLSQYRSKNDGDNIGIIVENKDINGLEINLECVIITFNHKFSMFNICCGPRSGINVHLRAAMIESYSLLFC